MKGRNLPFVMMAIFPILMMLLTNFASAENGITEGISFEHHLFNGQVIIKTYYWSDYNASTWKITDNKNLWIKACVIEQPENMTLYVEHMHADVFIEATKPALDGHLQDTMDDKIHGGTTPGFYISPEFPYYECFAVQGFSKWLREAWMFVFSGYGAGGATEVRLTEENIRREGAVGSEFAIVFDIVAQINGTNQYVKEIIYDDFIVYLDGSFSPNVGGTSEVEEKEVIWIAPNGLTGLIIGIAGVFSLITTAFLREHSTAKKIFLLLGIILLIAGVIVGLWGVHPVEVEKPTT